MTRINCEQQKADGLHHLLLLFFVLSVFATLIRDIRLLRNQP